MAKQQLYIYRTRKRLMSGTGKMWIDGKGGIAFGNQKLIKNLKKYLRPGEIEIPTENGKLITKERYEEAMKEGPSSEVDYGEILKTQTAPAPVKEPQTKVEAAPEKEAIPKKPALRKMAEEVGMTLDEINAFKGRGSNEKLFEEINRRQAE